MIHERAARVGQNRVVARKATERRGGGSVDPSSTVKESAQRTDAA